MEHETFFIDTETCGLHSFAVTLQYSELSDPRNVIIHDFWRVPIKDSLRLIERLIDGYIVVFNGVFDFFHLVKLYNVFRLAADHDAWPVIEEIASLERSAVLNSVVLKPRGVCDIFLHARKTRYQSTMERDDIKIRRVPIQMAQPLADELNKRVKLNPIYFARRKDKNAPQWKTYPSRDRESGEEIKGFDDVVLKFAPTTALKALAVDALNLDPNDVTTFAEVELDKKWRPTELGWRPWGGNWPQLIRLHIEHWAFNAAARKYAARDITYLYELWEFFERPGFDDNDSVLTACVANVRWRGFRIDREKVQARRIAAITMARSAPRAPSYVKSWLFGAMDEMERAVVKNTKKTTLEAVLKWELDDGTPHPAAERARAVIRAREAKKEVEILSKLLDADRFHPSFKVIGALSGRMAGADGLNPQGIKRDKEIRAAFLMADEGEYLDGGDFDSFEVCLAAAEYDDPDLTRALQSGLKIHALFAQKMFPEETYDDIVASKGTEQDKYTHGKAGVFSLIYMGDAGTLERKQGIDREIAEEAFEGFFEDFSGVKRAQERVAARFLSMVQRVPGGPVTWKEPAEYIESMFGFRRYFTLENQICKALFTLAHEPPDDWKKFNFRVRRREDRIQTALGAAQSALYGAAFAIQAANMRAAANHKIQSSGAQITKHLQVVVWNVQPCGVHPWRVRPMNIHDEIQAVTSSLAVSLEVKEKVRLLVESYRSRVPLIEMEWDLGKTSWASSWCKKCSRYYDTNRCDHAVVSEVQVGV